MPDTATDPWTTRRLLTWTTQHFERHQIDSPRLAAEMLLAHVLQTERLKLYLDPERPASQDERSRLRVLIEKATAHEPVDYLVGWAPFYNLQLAVDPRVLVPRPSTETLVEAVIDEVRRLAATGSSGVEGEDRKPDPDPEIAIADIGTGSGAIALALVSSLPQARVVATDRHLSALEAAQENADRLRLVDRLAFLEGHLLQALDPDQRFHVIVSNPPYIPSGDIAHLDANVRDHEPHHALDGGVDGLDLIRELIQEAPDHLRPGGLLAIEYNGPTQTELLLKLVYSDSRWQTPSLFKDHEGIERVLLVRLGP
ncbi:peptide chain release factor N(5)-glutamine methyltransferase [Mucisphaera sp.]|uniref:peptide chain release factor N(5)-glutamine methyltransferase n=1 Tax=Mucisphaera sp. TaxID=2913024 RepID=UPI003D0CCE23